MKNLLVIFCAASALYAAPSDEFFELSPEMATPFDAQDLEMPAPNFELPPPKNPALAASLSFLVPGLGHAYLGDIKTAGSLLGSTGATIGASLISHNGNVQISSIATAQAIWSYGVYAAFRDARIQNGMGRYSYQMPVDNLSSLVTAPIRPSVMKKPEVWGGILGALALAAGVTYFAYPDDARIAPKLSAFKSSEFSDVKIFPLIALPVGVSEEALFRGYLQTQLAEVTNPAWGIALSSLIFGAAHIPNGLALDAEERWRYYSFSIPFISALGAYFGWLTYKTHSLKESVAVHAWYDFILFTGGYLANRAAGVGSGSSFAVSVPF